MYVRRAITRSEYFKYMLNKSSECWQPVYKIKALKENKELTKV